MIKNPFLATLTATCMLTACAVNSEPPTRQGELNAIMNGETTAPALAGLAIAVIDEGETLYQYTGGMRRMDEGQTYPLGADDMMRIASISKLFVTVGLMQLVEKGDVDLDKDVSDYLGFTLRNPNHSDKAITLRQVLSHTSSIRDVGGYWMAEGYFSEYFIEGGQHYNGGSHFASAEGQGPGDYMEYSNLNFSVVAAVIERVSGERFDQYMAKNIFEPLDLRASFSACYGASNKPDDVVTLYRKGDGNGNWAPEGPWVPQVDYRRFACHVGGPTIGLNEVMPRLMEGYELGSKPTAFSPQGGMRASLEDMIALAKVLLGDYLKGNETLLTRASIEEMIRPAWEYNSDTKNGNTALEGAVDDQISFGLATAYGLSTHIANTAEWGFAGKNRNLVGHLGDAYGLLGQFWLDFENGDAFIALITGSADNPDKIRGLGPLYTPEDEVLAWWLRHF